MRSHLESVIMFLKYINAPAEEIAEAETIMMKYGNLTIDEYLARFS